MREDMFPIIPTILNRLRPAKRSGIALPASEQPAPAEPQKKDDIFADLSHYTALDGDLRQLARMYNEGTCKWVFAGALSELYGALDKASSHWHAEWARGVDVYIHSGLGPLFIGIRNDRRTALNELLADNPHVFDEGAAKTRSFDMLRDIGIQGFDSFRVVCRTVRGEQNINLTYTYNITDDWIDMANEKGESIGRYQVGVGGQDTLAEFFTCVINGIRPNPAKLNTAKLAIDVAPGA
jgi:hypothetical protein